MLVRFIIKCVVLLWLFRNGLSLIRLSEVIRLLLCRIFMIRWVLWKVVLLGIVVLIVGVIFGLRKFILRLICSRLFFVCICFRNGFRIGLMFFLLICCMLFMLVLCFRRSWCLVLLMECMFRSLICLGEIGLVKGVLSMVLNLGRL